MCCITKIIACLTKQKAKSLLMLGVFICHILGLYLDVSDPVCEKESYSLSDCTCLATHNVTCE